MSNSVRRTTEFVTDSEPRGTLSELDHAIIEALQRDARQPFTGLAQQLRTSEAHVRRRVKALLDADLIAITAVADPRVFGLESLAWLGLSVAPGRVEAVAELLVQMPRIDYAVITAGELNVMAEAACSTRDELYDLVLAVRSLPGVVRTETFVYLRLLRQSFDWSRGEAARRSEVRAVRAAVLEPLDVAIIQALQRNGRASFRELGRDLGVSERIVSARYVELTAMDAVRVTAVVNPLNLGWSAMAWLGIRVAGSGQFEHVAAQLGEIPEISYLVVASGRYDLMAEVVCRTPDDLLGTLTGRIGAIEGVASVDLFYYLRLLYRTTAGAWSAARSLAPGPGPGPGR
jgi:Lrp/AsnC family transcriptional regulator for asnA, asnC and gidA